MPKCELTEGLMPVLPVGTIRSPVTAFVVRTILPHLFPFERVDCIPADIAYIARNGNMFSIKFITLRSPVVEMTNVRPPQLRENSREGKWGSGV
jgi:hypothetical protein